MLQSHYQRSYILNPALEYRMATKLILLLRRSLNKTEARDIADDFGRRAESRENYYDGIANGGLDEHISALVKAAQRLGKLNLLAGVIEEWRPDLTEAVTEALAKNSFANTSQLPPFRISLVSGASLGRYNKWKWLIGLLCF